MKNCTRQMGKWTVIILPSPNTLHTCLGELAGANLQPCSYKCTIMSVVKDKIPLIILEIVELCSTEMHSFVWR